MRRLLACLMPLAVSPLAIFSPAVSADLSGPYTGGGIGLFGSYTAEVKIDDDRVNFGYPEWFTNLDLVGGYGEQFDSFYLGVEVALSMGVSDDDLLQAGDDTINLEAGQGYALSGRAGYLVTQSSMLYIKASYHIREFKVESSQNSDLVSEDDDFSGFGVGVGAEQQLQQGPLALRIAAMRVDYGDEDLDFEGDADSLEPVETTVDLQAVYRF